MSEAAAASGSSSPAPPPRRLNIVVNGCGHGELDSLYNSVARLEAALAEAQAAAAARMRCRRTRIVG